MRKLFVLVGALAALGGLASFATADVIQTFSLTVSPNKAKSSIGLKVNETTADSAGPGVQAPPLKQQKIRFQKGGKFNGNKFPRCKKAVILDKTVCSPSSGKKSSKIGSGKATAVALPIVPIVNAPLTLWNGEKQNNHDTVYVFAIPDIGPNLLTIGEVSKSKQGDFDYLLDFKIDDIQTLPGAPNASVTSVTTNTPKRSIKKGKKTFHLIQAPSKCTGKWKALGEFRYVPNDGSPEVNKTVPVEQSCKK